MLSKIRAVLLDYHNSLTPLDRVNMFMFVAFGYIVLLLTTWTLIGVLLFRG